MENLTVYKRRKKAKRKCLSNDGPLHGTDLSGWRICYLFMPQTTGWTQAGRYEAQIKAREAEVADRTRTDAHPRRSMNRWWLQSRAKRSIWQSAPPATATRSKAA